MMDNKKSEDLFGTRCGEGTTELPLGGVASCSSQRTAFVLQVSRKLLTKGRTCDDTADTQVVEMIPIVVNVKPAREVRTRPSKHEPFMVFHDGARKTETLFFSLFFPRCFLSSENKVQGEMQLQKVCVFSSCVSAKIKQAKFCGKQKFWWFGTGRAPRSTPVNGDIMNDVLTHVNANTNVKVESCFVTCRPVP